MHTWLWPALFIVNPAQIASDKCPALTGSVEGEPERVVAADGGETAARSDVDVEGDGGVGVDRHDGADGADGVEDNPNPERDRRPVWERQREELLGRGTS